MPGPSDQSYHKVRCGSPDVSSDKKKKVNVEKVLSFSEVNILSIFGILNYYY